MEGNFALMKTPEVLSSVWKHLHFLFHGHVSFLTFLLTKRDRHLLKSRLAENLLMFSNTSTVNFYILFYIIFLTTNTTVRTASTFFFHF